MQRPLRNARSSARWVITLAVVIAAAACGDKSGPTIPAGPATVIEPSVRLREILTKSEQQPPKILPNDGNFGSLTVPDPSGGASVPLTIKSLAVKVDVVGRLARTEVTQVFTNHLDRQTEGVYEFTLPEGAAISRLAMDVEGTMMEGEIVEKERAREIYNQILQQKRDPALLEWVGGNRFKTSIFPIFARSDKKVVLAYEQVLPRKMREVRYRYSMPNLASEPDGSEIGHFSFALEASGVGRLAVHGYEGTVTSKDEGGTATLNIDKFKPAGPVDVTFLSASDPKPQIATLDKKDEKFFLVDFVPDLPEQQEGAIRHVVVALDTSASVGQPELDRAKTFVIELLKTMPDTARYNIVYGDHKTARCLTHVAPVAEFAKAEQCLARLDAAGGSNLDALLTEAAKEAATVGGPASVVLVSDGTATLGELDGDIIRGHFLDAVGKTDINLNTVAIGHGPNEDYLASLAGAGRGHTLRMRPSDAPEGVVETLAALLQQPLLENVKVISSGGQVEGLTPFENKNLPLNLARGEAIAVMGKMATREAKIEVAGNYQGKEVRQVFTVNVAHAATNGLLRNFWARANIGMMQDQAAGRDAVVAASKRYGVMSEYTSFLVLENDAAYARFQVERSKEKERVETETAQAATKNFTKSSGKLQDLLQASAASPAPATADSDGESDDKEMDEAPREAPRDRFAQIAEVETQEEEGGSEKKDKAKSEVARPAKRRSQADPPTPKGGFGTTGAGRGGGGVSDGTFGIGEIGRMGNGIGGSGYGRRTGPAGDRSAQRPTVIAGRPNVTGALSMEVIRRIIRLHQREIEYCYQRELVNDPNLQGKIILQFTVAPNGSVAAAKVATSSLNNTRVESCMVGRTRGWSFPAPAGGGIVMVTYPFLLTSGGAGTSLISEDPMKELESRREALTLAEKSELLELYLAAGKDKQADKLVAETAQLPDEQGLPALLALLNQPATQVRFSTEFLAAALPALRQATPPAGLAPQVFQVYATKEMWNEAAALLGSRLRSVPEAASALETLVNAQQLEVARRAFNGFKGGEVYSTREMLDIVSAGAARQALREERFGLLKTLLVAEGATELDLINAFMALGGELDRPKEVSEALLEHCGAERSNIEFCQQWLANEDNPSAQKVLAGAGRRWLVQLAQERTEDVANESLIQRMVVLLEQIGEKDAALRLLSEVVEYTPHVYARRISYATQLVERNLGGEACVQYASAVMLEPAQRDTFRTMMALRRSDQTKPDEIKQCIVQGVSNLPVQRDVSLVLTWEDKSADVDLHIEEASGEEVWFQHKESQNGGLLYYDIVDGYGPEIYVLGEGPKGQYKLSLVYYSGVAKNIEATLTILKHAGSAAETREVLTLVLPLADPDVKHPLGAFNL